MKWKELMSMRGVGIVALLFSMTYALETVELKPLTIGNSIPITNGTLTKCQSQQFVYTRPNAPYLSVHFAHFSIVQGDIVTVANANGSEVRPITSPPGITSFSSSRIPGPTLVITFTPIGCLVSNNLPHDFGWTIDALEYTFPQAVEKQDVCGAANQNEPAVCFKHTNNRTSDPQVYTSSMAIARLMRSTSTDENERGSQLSCTGWLLGSDGHLVTNHHCIKNAEEANRTNFEFMVQSPQCDHSCRALGDCRDYGTVESYGADFIHANETLDYAIVRLRKKSCVLNGKYGFLSFRRAAPMVGELIYLVQHPNGGAKMITYTEDKDGMTGTEPAQVAAVNDENNLGSFWTSYYADTEQGSSGSPVISQVSHSVIALHSNGACKNSGAPSHLIVHDLESNSIQLPQDAFV